MKHPPTKQVRAVVACACLAFCVDGKNANFIGLDRGEVRFGEEIPSEIRTAGEQPWDRLEPRSPSLKASKAP